MLTRQPKVRKERLTQGCLPDDPRVDIALDDDEAIQQDEAEECQHADTIGYYNVPRHHSSAPEDTHTHLVRHKHNGPEHEEPAYKM